MIDSESQPISAKKESLGDELLDKLNRISNSILNASHDMQGRLSKISVSHPNTMEMKKDKEEHRIYPEYFAAMDNYISVLHEALDVITSSLDELEI